MSAIVDDDQIEKLVKNNPDHMTYDIAVILRISHITAVGDL